MSSTDFQGRAPASLGRRIGAGIFDLIALLTVMSLLNTLPMLTSGASLPMWGVLLAVLGYSVVPLSAFGATLGMRVFGIELIGRDGHRPNPGDVLFRELVGRGFFPAAFLFTLILGFVGSLLGASRFAMPTGLAWIMAIFSLITLAIVVPGHLFALARDDRRSLADLMARSCVVARRAPVAPEDEDERRYWLSLRRKKVTFFVGFELVAIAAGFGLPFLMTRPTQSTSSYADRIRRDRLEKVLAQNPADELSANELAQLYLNENRVDDARKVQDRVTEALVAKAGCDKREILRLGDRLNTEGKYAGAIALVRKHTADCGEWPRLLWVAVYAHEQLGQWKESAEANTKLIDADPEDSDYWWWRAKAHAKLGEYEQAAADHHQSMANRPNGFAASRYAEWAHSELKRACEAAFALEYWVDQRPDQEESWVQSKVDKLYLLGDCANVAGTGRTSIPLSGGQGLLAAQINRKPAKLAASPLMPYTVLRRETAQKLGLSSDGAATVKLRVLDEVVSAELVTVESLQLGKARAENIRVAIVDNLPEGIDGALGVNFLWRFRTSESEDGRTLRLEPKSEAHGRRTVQR